jgi:hypothetical protein
MSEVETSDIARAYLAENDARVAAEKRAEAAEALVEAATRFQYEGPDGTWRAFERDAPFRGEWLVYQHGGVRLIDGNPRRMPRDEAIAAARRLAGKKEGT